MRDPSPVFRALADSRRRVALSRLQRHRVISLPDLAELVTEQELDEDVVDVPGEQVRDVYLSLYHTHVPALTEAGLARYDQEDDLVTLTDDAASRLAAARDRMERLIQEG